MIFGKIKHKIQINSEFLKLTFRIILYHGKKTILYEIKIGTNFYFAPKKKDSEALEKLQNLLESSKYQEFLKGLQSIVQESEGLQEFVEPERWEPDSVTTIPESQLLEKRHIGRLTNGSFICYYNPDDDVFINRWKDFVDLMSNNDLTVISEYGEKYSSQEFLEMIRNTRGFSVNYYEFS